MSAAVSVSTPGKRKCESLAENKENAKLSDSTKKTKTSSALPTKSRLAAPSRGRSALPRPGAVSKSTSSLVAAPAAPSASAVPAKSSAASTELAVKEKTPVRKPAASRSPLRTRSANTATPLVERERRMQPIKDIVLDASQIAAKSVEAMKRIQKCMSSLKGSNMIKSTVESAISINEEMVLSTINSKLAKKKSKSQNYHDYKDMSAKQLEVIKDLRALFKTVFAEFATLKDTCSSIEDKQSTTMLDTRDELEDITQIVSILTQNDIRLRKDQEKLQDEMSVLSSAMKVIKSENDPLKSSMKDLEEKHWKVIEKLASEEALRMQAEADNLRLTNDLKTIRQESTSLSSNIKQEYEQRMELSVAGYRDEVAALRSDLSMKQKEFEKINEDKVENDKKASGLHDTLRETQAQLRESEGNLARAEKENEKLTKELAEVKSSLQDKEVDLRTTLASMQQIQMHSNDQTATLRTDLSAAQVKVSSLEAEKLTFVAEISVKSSEVASLTKDVAILRDSNEGMQKKLDALEAEMVEYKSAKVQLDVEREMREKSETREEAERTERIAACAQLLATQTDCSNQVADMKVQLEADMNRLKEEIAEKCRELAVKKEEISKKDDEITSLETKVKHIESVSISAEENKESLEQITKLTCENEVLKRHLREANEARQGLEHMSADSLKALEDQVRAGEIQRRKMHNLIQELRGNVRVFARVRPFLPNDGLDLSNPPPPTIETKHDGVSLQIKREANGDDKAQNHGFSFDKVFGPSSSQESVFEEVSEFVQSALDGYNVCLLSYGQTGSGKTHTMQGSGDGPMRGIIPRAMQQVGQYKTDLEGQGWHYEMEVTFVEIYNETIRDLLRSGSAPSDLKHDIKRDETGTTYISDVQTIPVDPNNASEIDKIMHLAARHRSVSSTAMNEQSSRSHSVFCLHLKATNKEQGTVLKGALSLVDLAGSERLDRSGATGAQAKETMAINKSLSSLTDVFVAIGNKQSHIPFRNSKLTYLLQPALSGDGKTLMMANLSPTSESFFESLCSLRFASQVNQCELGKPKKSISRDKDGDASAGSGAATGPARDRSSSNSAAQKKPRVSSR